jgi:NAD(P)-dependent dehydrogenase (short-subunit alcohol dehydrogenase family)
MDLGLKDKVAVITGGGTGIGLAVARGLAGEGVHVALCGRDGVRVSDQAQRIHDDFSVNAVGIQADVTTLEGINQITTQMRTALGGANILFSNAGEGTNETILNAPDDKWQYYWDLHVMATVRLTRGFVPMFREQGGGVIVNNASICARQPMGHEPIYNVTKAALVMLTKCLANELISENIRVNAINPGLIETEGWTGWARERAAENGTTWQDVLTQVAADKAPIKRFASPEELADFIVFLCSPRASYCVGSTYYVDGGWLNVVT